MSTPDRYFYRAYSKSSAGGLVSGKGYDHTKLSDDELEAEFFNHANSNSNLETALVSVSSRIIDTLRRAFEKFYKHGEQPDEIWIAIIRVPDADGHMYHHARELAKRWNHNEPESMMYEYVFEWEIEKYLIHKVSVATLMARGLDFDDYLLRDGGLLCASRLRSEFAKWEFDPSSDPWDIGLKLGYLAQYFGARAPGWQIAHQFLDDFWKLRMKYGEPQMRMTYYGEKEEVFLDPEYFCGIEEGIETVLIDWGVTSPDFLDTYDEHCSWAAEMLSDVDLECDWELKRVQKMIETAAIEIGL